MVGLLVGLMVGILAWEEFRAFNWLVSGLTFGLVAWLEAGVVAGMSRPGTDSTSPLRPHSSWRSDQAFGLVAGLAIWLGVGLVLGLLYWFAFRSWIAVVVLLPAALLLGLVAGLVYPQSWSSSLAFAQLAASKRTPVRLVRFLEDAHRRSVLRTVGPVYQFRHARLQDRLAAQEPTTTGQDLGEPRQTVTHG